jgi:SET domain-containing protein
MHFKLILVEKVGKKGRGVIAGEDIDVGEKIEWCPVLTFDAKHSDDIDKTPIYDYYFLWGPNNEQLAIALGYGSIYNHSFEPNAEYVPNYKENYLEFFALRPIKEGEEITVNYNGSPENREEVWFKTE